MQALQTRFQQTHDQHMMESNQLRALVQKLESQQSDQSSLQRMAQENNTLRESLAKAQYVNKLCLNSFFKIWNQREVSVEISNREQVIIPNVHQLLSVL